MNIPTETVNEGNADTPPPRQFQFSLGTLFTISTYCCIFAASLVWVFRSEQLGKLYNMPLIFVPSIPVMGFGLFVIPFLCLGMIVVGTVKVALAQKRPYSFLLFFGYVGVVLFSLFTSNPDRFWNDYSVRIVVAISLSACLTLGEVLVRRLSKDCLIAALLAMATAFGYYFFLVSAVACAGV